MLGRGLLASALVGAALSVAPGGAQAAVTRDEIRDAQRIAADTMRHPCRGPIEVRFERLRRDTFGIARWAGMWDVPTERRHDCHVLLNSRRIWHWGNLCTTIVHEYGHLAGRHHSHDPDSVMSAHYSRVYPGCDRD